MVFWIFMMYNYMFLFSLNRGLFKMAASNNFFFFFFISQENHSIFR